MSVIPKIFITDAAARLRALRTDKERMSELEKYGGFKWLVRKEVWPHDVFALDSNAEGKQNTQKTEKDQARPHKKVNISHWQHDDPRLCRRCTSVDAYVYKTSKKWTVVWKCGLCDIETARMWKKGHAKHQAGKFELGTQLLVCHHRAHSGPDPQR
jgi:hypothetical protein